MPTKYLVCTIIALLFSTSAYAEDWVTPERLQQNIAERAETAGINGLAYAVIRNGKTRIIETLGNNDDGTITDRSSLFRIGELSKLTTSIMLLRLIEQQQLFNNTEAAGTVGIDNPFNTQYPLKLEHLLSQTSGLPSTTNKTYKNYKIDINPSQISQFEAGSLKVLNRPGQHYLASNLDFTLAAAVAENKTGTPFDDLVSDLVFKPLEMNASSYSNVATINLNNSYDAKGNIAPYWKTSLRPSLAMRTNIEDMARLAEYIAGPEQKTAVLNSDSFTQLFNSNALAAIAGFELHPGKGLYPYVSSGRLFWGGTGQIDGFYASLGILTQSGDGFVLLANTHKPQDLRLIREALSHFASQRVPLPVLPEPAAVDHEQHQGWWVPVGQKSALSQWLWKIAGHVYLSASPEGLQITQVMPGIDLRQLVAIDETKYRPLRSDKAVLQFFEHDGEKFLISSTLEVYRHLSFSAVLPQLILAFIIILAFGGGLLMGLLAIPLSLIRALTNKCTILSQSLLGASSLCCITTIALFLQHELSNDFSLHYVLGSINVLSIGIALLSSIWPVLLLINIYLLWTYSDQFSRFAYRWSVISSFGQFILLAYLASNHWLPLLTWKY